MEKQRLGFEPRLLPWNLSDKPKSISSKEQVKSTKDMYATESPEPLDDLCDKQKFILL